MSRTALRTFFRRLVITSLPLAGGCAGRSLEVPITVAVAGTIDPATCDTYCPTDTTCVGVEATDDGQTIVTCEPNPPPPVCTGFCGRNGRRPATLIDEASPRASLNPMGALFAEMHRLEAASVTAFEVLGEELAAHGAPATLLRATARAAADEVRHTAMAAKLARRFGAEPTLPMLTPHAPRALVDIAIENAEEGCINESFGALLATWQAEMAGDPTVRAVMTRVAVDETRHAELAWRVKRWIAGRLDADSLALVADRMRCSLASLVNEVAGGYDAELVARAGLPSGPAATELVAGFANEVERRLTVGLPH